MICPIKFRRVILFVNRGQGMQKLLRESWKLRIERIWKATFKFVFAKITQTKTETCVLFVSFSIMTIKYNFCTGSNEFKKFWFKKRKKVKVANIIINLISFFYHWFILDLIWEMFCSVRGIWCRGIVKNLYRNNKVSYKDVSAAKIPGLIFGKFFSGFTPDRTNNFWFCIILSHF